MKSRAHKLKIEPLETREMLASVSIVDNVLQIRGDDNDDRFTVTKADSGIRITSPRLNGTAFGSVVFSSRDFKSIEARLFDGLDSLVFEQVEISQSISVWGGDGIDVLRFSGASNLFVKRVPESVSFFGGGGRDEFHARDSSFQKVTLNLGSGTGGVRLDEVTVRKEFSAFMADGDDSISIDRSEFRRFVKIDTGDGGRFAQLNNNKFLGSLRVTNFQKRDNVGRTLWFRENTVGRDINFRLGDGPDNALIRGNFVEGNVRISGDMTGLLPSGGDDEILVYNNTIEGNLSVTGGAGNDVIHIRGTEMNDLFLRAHAGNDQVRIQRVEAAMASLSLGEGNDTLLIEFSKFSGPLSVLGQKGNDLMFGFANELVGQVMFAGGSGHDQLFAIQSEFVAETEFLGQADDDEITAYQNSFLTDVKFWGGRGTNGYSAGLGIGEESNFFGGFLDERALVDIAAPDFRGIRETLRS